MSRAPAQEQALVAELGRLLPSRPSLASVIGPIGALARPESFAALGASIRALDEGARAHAAGLLGEAGNPEALEALAPLLDDASGPVRAVAAAAIAELGGCEAANPRLGELLLTDPAPGVRRAAVWALGETRTAAARQGLERARDDPDPQVRATVRAQLALF